MNTAKEILLSIILVSASAITFASSETGKIEPNWLLYKDGHVFFYLSGTQSGNTCTVIPERWSFDTTSAVGKIKYSTFLTAYTTGKEITVQNDDEGCVHGNTETVSNLVVH